MKEDQTATVKYKLSKMVIKMEICSLNYKLNTEVFTTLTVEKEILLNLYILVAILKIE